MTSREETPSTVWRLPAALFLVLLAILGLWAVPRGRGPSEANAPGSGTVSVAVSIPGEPPLEEAVDWSEGLTVRQATEAAYESDWRGRGPMAFLESLAGRANEGPDGLNWQFEVNGQYATRGAGAVTLDAGDSVLWKLAPYE